MNTKIIIQMHMNNNKGRKWEHFIECQISNIEWELFCVEKYTKKYFAINFIKSDLISIRLKSTFRNGSNVELNFLYFIKEKKKKKKVHSHFIEREKNSLAHNKIQYLIFFFQQELD